MKKQANIKILMVAMAIAVVFTLNFKAQAQSDKIPAPDFSEMEKDYEIVKWTYEDSGYIRLVIKPKYDPPHDHKYGFWFFDEDGVIVDSYKMIFNNGYSTPAGQAEKGEAYAPDQGAMRKVKSVIVYQLLSDNTIIGPKPNLPPKNTNSKNTESPAKTPPLQIKTGGDENNQSDAKCDYAGQPSTNTFQTFSVALAKAGIYERYGFNKDESIPYGVNFLEITPLGSYKNTVTVVPGRGAQRKHDGAPPNATIYRFHAKYIVCLKYSDSTVRKQYESDNVCFKANNGNWDCPVDSVPNITELKQ